MSMSDSGDRQMTYLTGVTAVTSGGLLREVVGLGYGSIWPWYSLEWLPQGPEDSPMYFREMEYGFTLYHPHSTLILFACEGGAIGCVLFLLLVPLALRRWLWARKASRGFYLWSGIMASLTSLLFDLFIVKNFKVTMIWWIFVVGGIILIRRPASPPRTAKAAERGLLRLRNQRGHGFLVMDQR